MQPPPSPLDYADPTATAPTGVARYAVASLATTGVAAIWFVLEFLNATPFDVYKNHRVGTVLAVLAALLAIGAIRDRTRARPPSVLALCLAAGAVLFYVGVTPL